MIYCVEDEKNIAELLKYALESSNFEVKIFDTISSFKQSLNELPKLILLDVMLPDGNGIELLKELKNNEQYKDIPIIMLTAKGSEFDKILGLDTGADDYVTKPFSVIELISRIKAVLRRFNNVRPVKAMDSILSISGLNLNPEKHEVSFNNNKIKLTSKEFELLKKLMSNPNIVLTRDTLLEDIWGYDYYGETRTVDVHIRSLRSKLPSEFNNIKTIHGVGYKLET